MANRCSPTVGMDFQETFSPTVTYESKISALALAATMDMELRQFHIMTAFVNALLQTEICMQQVPGMWISFGSI